MFIYIFYLFENKMPWFAVGQFMFVHIQIEAGASKVIWSCLIFFCFEANKGKLCNSIFSVTLFHSHVVIIENNEFVLPTRLNNNGLPNCLGVHRNEWEILS
ncbi:hypothetical protein KFK09_022688 [Dendrobium nobile]|uniref:Uncharacterized protein n=1 Tax=Dendrobium nobile TaxID=94219 RepID=A0A8T3AKM6_DENNO|nr:hypothetical protein KFK09_022688 [Dendrobium nobile]